MKKRKKELSLLLPRLALSQSLMQNSGNIEKIKIDIENNLVNIFSNYKISVKEERIYIFGVLILSVNKKIIDRYLIEIEMPDMKRSYYPTVKELGNKIPRIADRHINKGGTTCLFYPDSYKKYYNQKTRLSEFIKGPIFTYFIAQTYFEITGTWIFGELNHNEIGAYEFYSQKLSVKDPEVIVSFLNCLLKKSSVKNKLCDCGSLKKFKNCHHRKLVRIKRDIPQKMIQDSVQKILRFINEIKIYADRQTKLKELNFYIKNSKELLVTDIFYNKNSLARILHFLETKLPPKIICNLTMNK